MQNRTYKSANVLTRKEHPYIMFFFKSFVLIIVACCAYLSSQQMHWFDILSAVCPHKMNELACQDFAKSSQFNTTRNILIAHKLAMLLTVLAMLIQFIRMIIASLPMALYVKLVDVRSAWAKPLGFVLRLNGRMHDVNNGFGFRFIITMIVVMLVCCTALAFVGSYEGYYNELAKIINSK